MDTCSATHRERARLYICELAMNHGGDHRDGDMTWSSAGQFRPGASQVIDLR